ncbi:MAG: hypothetical protein A2Z06_00840 [Candidatus Glassbacteria bacterium RBG_16_58_8]|uniref:Cysteine-rich domain-containing protein n=1 Tax=Candidatus Glassbacteria bacterium RBG_16_58_8 TaxID=1817866 RepID=A0A1F5YAB0_9BACT|nr:MAG: hypothetical protein A2Z06_00840 [Candidatus Glassbacteria bacterium RBG_16_58_8]
MEWTVGIHRERLLLPFERAAPAVRADGRGGGCRGEIVYFPGCFAEYHSRGGEYRSSVAVLETMGYRVRIIDGSCCGIARLTIGDVEGFRRRAGELIARLDRESGNGTEIVFSSPSCLLCVREEYPRYLGDERTKAIASRSFDIMELLDRDAEAFGLREPAEKLEQRAVLHLPCHQRSNGSSRAFIRVMERIPGIRIVDVNDRCCGLAGTFGMRKARFDISIEMGSLLFRTLGDSEGDLVLTPCGACQLQIGQVMGTKVTHPVQYIGPFIAPIEPVRTIEEGSPS